VVQFGQEYSSYNNDVLIPLWRPLKRIFEKWDYSLPKRGRKQFGRDIKKLGEMAGIVSPVKYEFIKGGVKRTETKRKFELLVPHTPRRTGITTLRKTIPDSKVRIISGHSTEAAYYRYVKTTKEESALELANYDPF
jgi:hypothetical protein